MKRGRPARYYMSREEYLKQLGERLPHDHENAVKGAIQNIKRIRSTIRGLAWALQAEQSYLKDLLAIDPLTEEVSRLIIKEAEALAKLPVVAELPEEMHSEK